MAKNGNNEVERRRLQLDFSLEAHEQLEKLRKKAEYKTNAETVRNALRLLEWFLEQKRDGWRLQLVKGEAAKEIEILF